MGNATQSQKSHTHIHIIHDDDHCNEHCRFYRDLFMRIISKVYKCKLYIFIFSTKKTKNYGELTIRESMNGKPLVINWAASPAGKYIVQHNIYIVLATGLRYANVRRVAVVAGDAFAAIGRAAHANRRRLNGGCRRCGMATRLSGLLLLLFSLFSRLLEFVAVASAPGARLVARLRQHLVGRTVGLGLVTCGCVQRRVWLMIVIYRVFHRIILWFGQHPVKKY